MRSDGRKGGIEGKRNRRRGEKKLSNY